VGFLPDDVQSINQSLLSTLKQQVARGTPNSLHLLKLLVTVTIGKVKLAKIRDMNHMYKRHDSLSCCDNQSDLLKLLMTSGKMKPTKKKTPTVDNY
jgi:hypothetical protein